MSPPTYEELAEKAFRNIYSVLELTLKDLDDVSETEALQNLGAAIISVMSIAKTLIPNKKKEDVLPSQTSD